MSNPFDRNPFLLPPPWNAGYALPQNVDDEGLERRTYTTAWAARGSFDDPKVGTAGYAVPGYVKDEGYGVGAMVTRWAPRGSYAGPKVPHWLDKKTAKVVGAKMLPGGAAQIKIETMAGVEQAMGNERAPLTAYGLTVSKALIDTVKMMPPDERKKQLKLALNLIDPKLYRAAEADADKEAKLGVPADIALERGLGAAVSYGLAKELVDLNKGKKPGKNSQLGCAQTMLGQLDFRTAAISPTLSKLAVASTMTLVKPAAPAELANGSCIPERPGYIWVASTGSVPGHWERMRVGQTCATYAPAGTVSVTVRDQRDGAGGGGGVTVTDSAGNVVKSTIGPAPAPTTAPADQVFANIGPFLIPVTGGAWRDHRALSAEKKAYVDENIAIASKAGGVSIAEMKRGRYPFVKFKAGPTGQESWGLYYTEEDGTRKTSRGTLIPAGTIIAYHKIPDSQASQLGDYSTDEYGYESLGFSIGGAISSVGSAIKDAAAYVGGAIWDVLKKIWKGIKWVTMKIVHFVVDAAKWVAKQTCKLVSTPGVVQASQAVATAAPNPYTIGVAAGVTVTKMLCDKYGGEGDKDAAAAAAEAEAQAAAAAAAAAAEAEAQKKKTMMFLLVGGAGLAAVLLLSGKKK